MKRLCLLLLSTALLFSFAEANTKDKTQYKNAKLRSGKLITYTINSGDTLSTIAQKYHTSVKKLAWINSIKKDSRIKVGKSLKIPVNTQIDNIEDIEITLASVMQKIEKNRKLERLRDKLLSHKVKKGDSLYLIAKNNHTTVKKLKEINNIRSSRNLKLGQLILIPGTSKKTKIAKKKKLTNKKIASAKSSSRKKLVVDAKSGKTTMFKRFSTGKTTTLELAAAKKQLGKRYVWGATGPRTFDCSGFTSYICKKSGVNLPRTSINQSKVGKRVNRSNLRPGDLVFFDTSKQRKGYINHVGIYLGNNKFIHASSAKKKVVITSLEKPFYKARFKWGSRVKS